MDGEGDDNFQKQSQSAEDATKDKYAEDTKNFSAKDLGLGNGVVKERGIADFLCLLIFIAFLSAMGFCTYWGNKHGQLEKLMAPLDGDDNFCGFTTGTLDLAEFPKLFITDLTFGTPKEIFKKGVCVKTCPQKGDKLAFHQTSVVKDMEKNAGYNTKQILGYCFPSSDLP
jgi:hypothetical protein